MELIFNLCLALSAGIVLGFTFGAFKMVRRPKYTEKQLESAAAFRKKSSVVAKYLTFFVLALGFVWCCYYLVLGAIDPEQVDYATGMSQLIVSVLTIVSIAFAFFEFIRAK